MADLRFDARMSDLEALIWALESEDPRLRSTMAAVAVLDSSPGIDALRRRLDRVSRVVTRLRDRVVDGRGTLSTPRWEPDPHFDLAFHVRALRAPRRPAALTVGGPRTGRRAGDGPVPDVVLRLAEPWVAEGFDRARPLWQMLLVDDLPGGRAAVVIKLHHTFTDGVGAVRLAGVLFDFAAEAPIGPLPPVPPTAGTGPLARLAGDLAHEARRTASIARRGAVAVASDVMAATGRAGAASAAAQRRAELVGSLASLAAPTTRPLSPILTGRSARLHLDALMFPLDAMRAAGRAAGGTVNDAFVAGILAGLRIYHQRHGSEPGALRIGVPVSTHDADAEPTMRNAFVPVRIDAPLQLTDPGESIAAVHRLVATARAEPGLASVAAAAAAALRVPVARALASAAMATIDVVASNVAGVPGPEVRLFLAGAPVRALVPFGPRSRAALNVTMLSLGPNLGIGVNIDPVAAPDPGVLMASLRTGLADTLALGSAAGTPPRPASRQRGPR
jgi:diacylglycerol O-acyltransferase